ncbi:hypothetical protein BDF22DRAFT_676707 [Syncephalis plumigaleata]|nr:hypothetical protein BDF22DRAFT_676707 [Syncephalis plumigaleata]
MSYFTCKHQSQLWTLLLGVLIQIIHINARLTITANNNNLTVNLQSYDFFLYREPYYKLRGIGLEWGIQPISDGGICRFQPLNNSDTAFVKAMQTASPNINLAVVVEMYTFFGRGCTSRAKAQKALNKLSGQLVEAGYAPVSLLVITNVPDLYTPRWDANFIGQSFFGLGSTSSYVYTPITLLPFEDTSFLRNALKKKGTVFTYTAEEDQGPWNEMFLGTGFVVVKWVYFAIVLAAFTYSLTRSIALYILNRHPRDIRLIAFACSLLYVIVLLAHIVTPSTATAVNIVGSLCNFLSSIPFDIILIHWSIHGKSYFSRIAVILFRVVVAINLVLLTLGLIFQMFLYNDNEAILNYTYKYVTIKNISDAIPLTNAVIFAGFTLWFVSCLVRLRKHPVARNRFIQLILFTILACFTFVVFGLYIILNNLNLPIRRVGQYALFDILYKSAYVIRALVFLAVLGVRWPRNEEIVRVHAPLDGDMTEAGDTMLTKPIDRLQLE